MMSTSFINNSSNVGFLVILFSRSKDIQVIGLYIMHVDVESWSSAHHTK